MTLNQKIETVYGNLQETYNQCVKGTIQHVDQIMNERRKNHELRNQFFYTADGMVYSLDNKTPTLRITRELTNPIFNHLEDNVNSSYEQLTTSGNYQVLATDFDAVKVAPDTVTIDLTKLTLQDDYFERHYLIISPTNYDMLTSEDRKLAERVYGQGTDFVQNMQLLHDTKIKETRIYILNSEYVQEYATKNPIGRASWLFIFGFNSSLDAFGRNVERNDCMRGVRKP